MMTIYDFKRLVLTHFKGKQFFFEKEDAKLTNDKLVKDLFSNKSSLKITFQLHCWKTKISEIKIKQEHDGKLVEVDVSKSDSPNDIINRMRQKQPDIGTNVKLAVCGQNKSNHISHMTQCQDS